MFLVLFLEMATVDVVNGPQVHTYTTVDTALVLLTAIEVNSGHTHADVN
jgi:hypothetical protein